MTKDTVLTLAERRAAAEIEVKMMGMQNLATETFKRVEQEAAYRIAQDKAIKADSDYRVAFDQWAAAGYPE